MFQNFDKPDLSNNTPGALIDSLFLFSPKQNEQLGEMNQPCLYFWQEELIYLMKQKDLIISSVIKSFSPFKYFLLCYKRLSPNHYIPQYVLTDEDFQSGSQQE